MKLLFENWRKHLNEEKYRIQIINYLEENNIVLTEAELEEAMPKWLRKLGTGAALAATLASAGGVGQSAEAGWFGGGGAESSQEQAAPEVGPSEDGSSFTAKFEVADDVELSMQAADSLALEGASDNGLQGAEVTSRTQVGGFIYSTASVN
jgi:hypothetical protein